MKKEITISLTKDKWNLIVNEIEMNGLIEGQGENISLVLEPDNTNRWPSQKTTAFMTALARALSSNQTIASLELGRFLKAPEENERETLQRDFKNVFEKNKTLTALKLFGPGCSMIILNALKDVLAIPNVNTSVAIREIGLGAFTADNTSLDIPVFANVLNALPNLTALTLKNLNLKLLLPNLTVNALASLQTLKLPHTELTKPLLNLLKEKLVRNLANLRVIKGNFSGNEAALELTAILSAQTNLEIISLQKNSTKKNTAIIDLTKLLSAIKQLTRVEKIIFTDCQFNEEKITTLFESLQGKTSLRKLILNDHRYTSSFYAVPNQGNRINPTLILQSMVLNSWPQLNYLKLHPSHLGDHVTLSALTALIKQNAIVALCFESKVICFESLNTIVELLDAISCNQSLKILHFPERSNTFFQSEFLFPDDILFYPALRRCLEKNQHLRDVRIPLPFKKERLTEFSHMIASQNFITTLHIYGADLVHGLAHGNRMERPVAITQAILQNRSLEKVLISWETTHHAESWGKEDNALEQHLQQNRQRRLSNIAYFIGMLSMLSESLSQDRPSHWFYFPPDIRSQIWQFWQLEFPMGKTSEQVDKCARFLNGSSSAIKQLVQSKSQRPLLLIERLTHQFELRSREEEFTPTSTSGLRIEL